MSESGKIAARPLLEERLAEIKAPPHGPGWELSIEKRDLVELPDITAAPAGGPR